MILDMLEETKGDLSTFDEEGSWPVMIDEFVAHMKGESAAN
jgi:hypothetical protein